MAAPRRFAQAKAVAAHAASIGRLRKKLQDLHRRLDAWPPFPARAQEALSRADDELRTAEVLVEALS